MEKNENEFEKIKSTKEWSSFYNYYTEYNLFDQLDFFRYEDMHTNILCSLLANNNAYQLGTFPLKKLIELLILKDKNKIKIDADDLNKYNIENVNIESQKVIERNRLDLEIYFSINNKNYSIILENKVYSGENAGQCEKYYKYFKENGDNQTNYIFVYLSLEKNSEFSCKEKYINITYHELVTKVIEPCSDEYTNSNPKIISLDLYLSSFSKLYEDISENYDIPLTCQGKEVTNDLYKKYNNLLLKPLMDKNKVYNENKKILGIYYYNIHKLIKNKENNDYDTKKIIEKNFLNIRCRFKKEPMTYRKCYLKILKYLFEEKKVQTQEDVDLLNDCAKNKNYVIAIANITGLPHEGCYNSSNPIVGELKLDSSGETLFYYDDSILESELRYFVEAVNDKFGEKLDVEIN